jgi:hypothetical protein
MALEHFCARRPSSSFEAPEQDLVAVREMRWFLAPLARERCGQVIDARFASLPTTAAIEG